MLDGADVSIGVSGDPDGVNVCVVDEGVGDGVGNGVGDSVGSTVGNTIGDSVGDGDEVGARDVGDNVVIEPSV